MDEAQQTPDSDHVVATETSTTGPTRLRRSTKRRMVGGVAGGIGERFDIDPNIVRVVFVVLTVLYGLGAAIYLAMWVLIPQSGKLSDDGVEESVDAPSASNVRLLRYVLLAGVVVGAIIVLSTFGGAPRIGNGVGVVWLIFLAVLAILSLRSTARQHMLRRFIALVFLSVLTLFILCTSAFLGFIASTGVPMHGGIGVRVIQPTTPAQVSRDYRIEFGGLTVDLRHVALNRGTTSVTASVAVGILSVDVPSNAIVYLKTNIGAGSFTFIGPKGYATPFSAVPSSMTVAQQRTAPHLILNVEVGAGRIYLRRGGDGTGAPLIPGPPSQPATITPTSVKPATPVS